MESVATQINELDPDLLVVSGDLTLNGYRKEFVEAKKQIDQIACQNRLIVPGNHDSSNAGYMHFLDVVGPRLGVFADDDVVVVGVDSTQPDLDDGRVGRSLYDWIEQSFSVEAGLRVFVLHHHLLPVPDTGRERNVCYDAADVIKLLLGCKVDLVLSGHKHVPYAWNLNGMTVTTAGTVCSSRLRGVAGPSYNVIHCQDTSVSVDCVRSA
jgi:3',5'-cyclic AMP phosphodiesterase CpdA